MPQRDGTGPNGAGARTGRQRGPCVGAKPSRGRRIGSATPRRRRRASA